MMKDLIDLKNIFSKQLPKMPKEYICKLMFDRKHEAVVIKKISNKAIIGGICFRVYEEQNFAEIAFLAISTEEQIKVAEFQSGLREEAYGYAKKRDETERHTVFDDIR
jgi:hypothetical protein